MSTAKRLREVVGQRVRELREQAGLRQDDLVLVAGNFGLPWNHSRIGALERGAKAINAEELVLLPVILGLALGRSVSMGELFDSDGIVQLTKMAEISARGIPEVLRGTDPIPHVVRLNSNGAGAIPEQECDERTRRRLGLDADSYAAICVQLWGHSLSVERDSRLKSSEPINPASLAARRGRVTRKLMTEARSLCESLR